MNLETPHTVVGLGVQHSDFYLGSGLSSKVAEWLLGPSGVSPVTARKMIFSHFCFSSSLSAAKLCTDLDWVSLKLWGRSALLGISSTI